MHRHEIVTLSAKRVVSCNNVIPHKGSDYPAFLTLDSNMQGESALFDLLSICLRERGVTVDDNDERALTPWIVFVSFERLFYGQSAKIIERRGYREGIERLLADGFSIERQDGDDPSSSHIWHYSVFDKTSSMAKKSTISFVADIGWDDHGNKVRVLDEVMRPGDTLSAGLDERLRLGIDFTGEENWTKYYAYRGLYLTDGKRIADSRLMFDEEHVLVVDPKSILGKTIIKGTFLTASGAFAQSTDRDPVEIEPEETDTQEISPFDGEGIVSARYAKLIAKAYGREDATSFQIRMPFIKGMLHAVDFHSFVMRECLGLDPHDTSHQKDYASRDLVIRDAFGRQRRWQSVEMILTTDMVKCHGWLKKWVAGDVDPMRYYFKQFRKYNHALYIHATEDNLNRHRSRRRQDAAQLPVFEHPRLYA